MQLQQWILFGMALFTILIGVCLMAYGAVAKGAYAGGGEEESSKWAQIINALANLVKALGDFLGTNRAGKVGLLLIVVGFVALYFAFSVASPAHATGALDLLKSFSEEQESKGTGK